MKKYTLIVLAVLSLMIAAGTKPASADIVNQIEVTIPFAFYVDNTSLPPGKYTISRIAPTDPRVLELRSEDGKTAVLFTTVAAQAASAPSKTMLVFKKYGDKEVLSQIFEAGDPDGAEIPKSRYEDAAAQGGTAPEKHSVEGKSKKQKS